MLFSKSGKTISLIDPGRHFLPWLFLSLEVPKTTREPEIFVVLECEEQTLVSCDITVFILLDIN